MYTDKLEVACEFIVKLNYTDENTDKKVTCVELNWLQRVAVTDDKNYLV